MSNHKNALPASNKKHMWLKGLVAISGFVSTFALAQSEIVIGATVPITGPASLTGKQYHNSLKLAEENINKAGGINGKNIRFFFEDAQSSNGTAMNAFVKLVQEKKPPFVFLTSYSTQNAAVAPEVLKAKIPVMFAGGADALEDLNNPYMFRIRPQDGIVALAMAGFVKEKLKGKKPGIIYIQNDFGQGGSTAAAKQFAAAGITLAGMEAYGQNDKDMSAQLINLKNKGADVILAFVYPQDGALLLRQIKSLGLKQPVVASSAAFVPAAMQLMSPADLENVWGVIDTMLEANPLAKDFIADYKKKFGADADPYAAAYYDGAMIMAAAMKKVGTDPEKIREYLADMKGYQGVGANFSFDAKRNGVHEVTVVNFKKDTKDMIFISKIGASK